MYLENTWYVAAWSRELTRQPLGRTICERSIVFFRALNGDAVALGNRCPHRFAPLSSGRLGDDQIQCGYHGLRFDASGACVLNPHGNHAIPSKLRVAAYPVIERYDMVWIWIGDSKLSDATLIPDFQCNVDPKFARIDGMFEVQANYELVTDNLLDLTHAEFVHDGVLSSEAITASRLKTSQAGTTIWSNRWCPSGEPSPAWRVAFDNYAKPVDQWLYMRWDAPAHMLLDVGLTPQGEPRSAGIWLYGTDVLTPKDARTTYCFWAFARNYRTTDASVDEFWRASIKLAFEEQDKPIIEAQQRMIGNDNNDDPGPVIVASDSAAVLARRQLRKLIKEQGTGGPTTRPGSLPPLELLKERVSTRLPVEPVV